MPSPSEPARETLVLRVPATVTALAGVRDELSRWLERAGATPTERAEILIAVWEAVVNAIEHPIGSLTRDVAVEAAALPGRCVRVAIRDSGLWLPRRSSGPHFGLSLINELMDDVEVESDGDGTTIYVRRSLGGRGEAREG